MSAACSKCGDCCEVIAVWFEGGTPMVEADLDGWRNQLASGEPMGMSDAGQRNAEFISQHWHRIAGAADGLFTCDQFDRESRLCLAHETRPGICQGYPWYDRQDHPGGLLISRRCAFWEDVPETERPADLTAFAV